MFCVIWYHLCNLKNVKNTHGGVLLLKVTLLRVCFSRFLNCTNGTKSRNAGHVAKLQGICHLSQKRANSSFQFSSWFAPPMLQILDTKASHKHRASFRCFLLLLSNMCDIYNLNPHFKFCLIHPTKLASATFHISDRLRHSNPTIKSMGRVNLTLLVPIPDEERKLA